MPKLDCLCKLALAATISILPLCSVPAFAASTTDYTLFPPQMPGTPAGSQSGTCKAIDKTQHLTYTLVWDGQSNVQCSTVPTDCTAANQALQFDGSNFICACNVTTNFVPTGPCPTGSGNVGNLVTTACPGTPASSVPANTCDLTEIQTAAAATTSSTTTVDTTTTPAAGDPATDPTAPVDPVPTPPPLIFPAASYIQCSPGDTVWAYQGPAGFSVQCDTVSCIPYSCTNSGLVPQ